MNVIRRFRKVVMPHIRAQIRQHRQQVLTSVKPAVQYGGGETVAQVVNPDFWERFHCRICQPPALIKEFSCFFHVKFTNPPVFGVFAFRTFKSVAKPFFLQIFAAMRFITTANGRNHRLSVGNSFQDLLTL